MGHYDCKSCGASPCEEHGPACSRTPEPVKYKGNLGVHTSHCYQGEYEDCCKYGDPYCPATPEPVAPAEIPEWAKDKAARQSGWRDYAHMRRSHPGPKSMTRKAVDALARLIAKHEKEPEPVDPNLAMAKLFHETYERLAPNFGYQTREETRQFNPSSPNGKLMLAVCAELAKRGYGVSRKVHRSDCAIYNEPASPNGPCDCGYIG